MSVTPPYFILSEAKDLARVWLEPFPGKVLRSLRSRRMKWAGNLTE